MQFRLRSNSSSLILPKQWCRTHFKAKLNQSMCRNLLQRIYFGYFPWNEITVCRTFLSTIRGTNPLIKSTPPLCQAINLTPWSNWTIKFSLSILCGEGDRSLEKVDRSLASLHTRPPTAIEANDEMKQRRQDQVCSDNSWRCWTNDFYP